jgi:small subunit ribosomal protein S6
MRRYETIVIIDPDLSEEDRTSLLNRAKEIIPQQQGVFIQDDLWGVRKLAYEINKKPRGYYALLDYCGTGKAVDELERFFRIDDRAMKFITVQLDADADPEKIKADIAAAKASAQQASTPAEPATAPVQQPVTEDESPSIQATNEGEITPEQ